MVRTIALFSSAAVVVGLAAGVYFTFAGSSDDPFASCRRSAVAGGVAAIGGPFSLVDSTGARVTDANVITKPTLIYFGYATCPDFCPMDLARNAAAATILAEQGLDVGQVFITVDPARDTPEVLAGYTAYFHEDLIGLTGTEEETAAAAGAYRVYASRREGDDEFYLVDHSTFTYLVAPEQGFLEYFPSDAPAEEVASSVKCYAAEL
jgi:protein SCO1/2